MDGGPIAIMGRPLKKQLEYINSLGIPYALFAGEKELKAGKFKLKDMKSGNEKEVGLDNMEV